MKKIISTSFVFSLIASAQQGAPFVEYAGCREADYVVVATPTATVGADGRNYSPKCLKVKPGTSVTVHGSGGHPLQGVEKLSGQPTNPYFGATPHNSNQTHTLNEQGVYGQFCERHGNAEGEGMAGAIWVSE